jgi:hypothetical protein
LLSESIGKGTFVRLGGDKTDTDSRGSSVGTKPNTQRKRLGKERVDRKNSSTLDLRGSRKDLW